MSAKGVRKLRAILPPGAKWETRTDPCLKCRLPFTRRGMRLKDGRWIGDHLCSHCNESNKDVRGPRSKLHPSEM